MFIGTKGGWGGGGGGKHFAGCKLIGAPAPIPISVQNNYIFHIENR